MTTIIKRCRGKEIRCIRAIDGFRKKLMIPDSKIPKYPEFEVKSKIGKVFKKQNRFDPYFYEHCEKNYFRECFLAAEINEKGHIDRDIIFEQKRQEALGKKLVNLLL